MPLVGFRAEWDEDKLIEAALPLYSRKEDKADAVHLIYRCTALETQSAKKLRRVEAIAASAGIELPGLKTRIADIDAHETALEKIRTANFDRTPTEIKEERNWDAVFAGCDLTTGGGIAIAHRRFRAGNAPFYTDAFFRNAIERVQIGKEAEFVTAFGSVAEFDLYDVRNFLEALPATWRTRLGIKASLATMLKTICRRFCMTIKRSRYYEALPLKLACELSGVDESELLDVILAGIGESMELAGPERLFSLVGLLSGKLTSTEALEALSYGLDLFNVVLEDSDGDGPWTAQLTLPTAVEDSLAGYIWAALASPVASTRWEAGHVVVGLCALRRTRVIAGLLTHASANTTKPFGDHRFAFYNLHAQQWLMIAAARAASEYGTALVPHANHFLMRASADQSHVLIRLFAARAMLTLAAQGLITLPADVLQRLDNINASPFETVERDSSQERVSHVAGASAEEEVSENDQYFFGIDFGPYWLAPLGRCFGISQPEVERETLNSIRGALGYAGTHRWDEDERMRRSLYQHEVTSHSHGSYPRVEDYGFYLSYHAMLITAGRLLATKPLVNGSNDWEDNRFSDWLKSHDISRNDGRWLADRRDPQPTGRPDWLEDGNKTEWLGSIAIDDFEHALYPAAGFLTAWGRWSELDTSREESISVHTALVSRERSTSLLRALQTTANPHDFRIPDADDDLQIDQGPYRLKGWIVDRPNERGIDESDLWAGDVRFPSPEPAAFVIELMRLVTDSDRREWQAPSIQTPVLRSETWGYFPERDSSEQPTGRRLQASIQFVVEFLTAISMDLIVEVEIQRRSRHQHYEKSDNDELQNIPPSTRIYIVKGDGTIRAL